MLSEKTIKSKFKKEQYYFSKHADQERQNDNLLVTEIEQAVIDGRVLEEYPDTGRGESCLIAGFSNEGKPIHIVCGLRGNFIVIITVYIPTPPKFKTPYERG